MGKIGLIAGGGMLPVEFVRSVKQKGDRSVVFAIKGMASEQLDKEADKVYWVSPKQYKLFVFYLLKERIRNMALLGKVDKSVLYQEDGTSEEITSAAEKLKDTKDYSILEEVTKHLGRLGVQVIDGLEYLSHLLPEEGVLSELLPGDDIDDDISFGHSIAKQLADMDVGQTIVVKDKAVVAVEAMEGTDETIKRAYKIVGDGCVMIKVSRSSQDLRWDVPVVGAETMECLAKNKFSALAIESGKMYLVDKQRSLQIANQNNIIVKAL